MTSTAASNVWKALADSNRRRILDLLKEGPQRTGDVAARFDMTRFGVMKHLTALAEAGLIRVERRGRERWNHLDAGPLRTAVDTWVGSYEALWADRLQRVKAVAEAPVEGKGDGSMNETTHGTAVTAHIQMEIVIGADPGRVFDALTTDIGAWWGPPYLANDNATDVVLDLRPGGVLGEVWAGGGTAWGILEVLQPPALLQFSSRGSILGAVAGLVRFELSAAAGGTVLALDHRVIGLEGEMRPELHEKGWSDLLGRRLKAYVETGERLGLRQTAATGG